MNITRRSCLQIVYSFLAVILLMVSPLSYAVVIIAPNTIINTSTTYSNDTLDLTNGSFIVKNNATLTIENCTIIGTISNANPTLINVEKGILELKNNDVQLTAAGITPHPQTQSLHYMMMFGQAQATIVGNKFKIAQIFSAGLLINDIIVGSKNIQVLNNTFENFHGVLYLLNANNITIDGNVFKANSYGNIVLVGTKGVINGNKIYFSGRKELGNAMDILDSENMMITNNVIFTPTCHGIYIIQSENVLIDGNTVTGGITYAMSILSEIVFKGKNAEKLKLEDKDNYALKLVTSLGKKSFAHRNPQNIVITNNVMGQNRYGIAAYHVDNLTVSDNYFTQRFDDAASRKFWTDNSVLLQNVTGLTWTNNIYQEAFTQINGGDNSMVYFVEFPATGGVVL